MMSYTFLWLMMIQKEKLIYPQGFYSEKTGMQIKSIILIFHIANYNKLNPLYNAIDCYNYIFRHYIRRTLERHNLDRALIRIPLNISYVPLTEINQPPWLIW